MDDLLGEFLTETAEGLAKLDLELVRLEQNPEDPGLIGSIFRIVHTIKGTCGFLDLPRLETLAHAAENVLGRFRDRELRVTPASVTLILQTLDQIKAILATIESTEKEPTGDDSGLIARLDAVAAGRGEAAAVETIFETMPAPADAPTSIFERLGGAGRVEAAVAALFVKVSQDPALSPFFAHTTMEVHRAMVRDYLIAAFGGPNEYVGADLGRTHAHLKSDGLGSGHFDAFVTHLHAALSEHCSDQSVVTEALAVVEGFRRDVVAVEAVAVEAPVIEAPVVDEHVAPAPKALSAPAQAAMAPQPPKPEGEPEAVGGDGGSRELSSANQSIRVGVSVLENLMTMVSELVLVRNQLLQMARNQQDSEFAAPLQQLNHITSELQEGVMKTRMQPIGNAWAKLPRIVRDVAQGLGKKVDLEMVGAETELDRQVLELIKDPLTHMIRNAVDHGLERSEDRAAQRKPETGKIRLHAYHEGGQIIIRVADDGRGLSTTKIKEKIVRNGLANVADVEAMSDAVAQQFIFKPGFSTAEQITNVSGRGVGLDVVRSNIEKIGGSIEMQSEVGRGTTFTIKIPLTLAIVSALIVECGGQRFAIPQISVRELVRASRTSEHRIETIDRTPVLRLRDRLLPLVSLREMLGIGDAEDGAKDVFVVVTQVGTNTFGMMVDRVFDAEEIVVKPVAPMLRDCPVYSGNTILGDGSIVMILDPNGIATLRADAGGDAQSEADETAAAAGDARVPLLVFTAGSLTPKAVPLALVARLEEIETSCLEIAEGRDVVQYRGGLMPLVKIEPTQSLPTEGHVQIVVFTDRDRSMGLVVDRIVDIVEDKLDFKLSGEAGRGVMGTALIAGKATEVIDTGYFLHQAFSDWFRASSVANGASRSQRSVLFVDDSAFFRNLLAPLLRTAGYDVTAVESAEHAMALCDSGRRFDAIISDIDMPEMDGLHFARTVRNDPRWCDTPLIALSGSASEADRQRGRDAGFADYVPKFDRDSLLGVLAETLSDAREAA